MKRVKTNLSLSLMLALLAVGCAGPSFKNSIQTDKFDILSEESFMRYNTNRLAATAATKRDFISLALIACHEQKITKGLGILEAQMHSSKTNPFYWNALGTCNFLNKDYPKSIFFYGLGMEAAKSTIKDYSDTQKKIAEAVISNNLGLIHLTFKRYNEAYDAFTIAKTIAPNYFTPDFNIAQLFLEFNENEKALTLLKKLEAKNSQDIDLLYSLSLAYYRKNEFDKSFQYITRVQQDYLNRADIVGLYAYNLMKKNRLVEAKQILEKRLYAQEYNERNSMILEEVNQKIKDMPEELKAKQ